MGFILLPVLAAAPEEAEEEIPRRISTGSRLSDYGAPSQTQGIKIHIWKIV